MANNLLIFFGQLRTFEYVIPHLKRIDEVDVVISTWSENIINNEKTLVNEDLIRNTIPNIKQIHISNQNDIKINYINKHGFNFNMMIYHWKTAINNIENVNQYDKIIIHRCDLYSDWDRILDLDIQDDTIYLHHNNFPYCTSDKYPNAVWCNDYFFFGKPTIIKKYINCFDRDDYIDPHLDIYKTLYDNNIKYERYVLYGKLLRDITDNPTLAPITGPNELMPQNKIFKRPL